METTTWQIILKVLLRKTFKMIHFPVLVQKNGRLSPNTVRLNNGDSSRSDKNKVLTVP